MNLNWTKLLKKKKVFIKEEKRKTGFNIYSKYNTLKGIRSLIEGICISRKSKKQKLVRSSMLIRSKLFTNEYYLNFPIFFSGAFNYKIIGFSYKRKKIICSKLTKARF